MYDFRLLKLCIMILLLSYISISVNAQTGVYCNFHRINDVAWSPDGEYLAVMTLHGVLIYDYNLSLIRSVEAPVVGYDTTSLTGLVWSSDSQWIILPDHTLPEIALQGYYGWSIVNADTGELRSIMSPVVTSTISELVWSPDNDFILALQYESAFGSFPAQTTIIKISGLFEGGYSPITQQYDDVHLINLQWTDDNTISAQQNGLTLYFNTSLELLEIPPIIYPSWWINNSSNTYAVAQPHFDFLIHTIGEEPQTISIDPTLDNLGNVIAIPLIDEFIWLSDEQRIIGIYSNHHMLEQNIELSTLLQGIIVDVQAVTQEQGFLLQADGIIDGYAVSTEGDRIVVYRDDIWLELWNPLTEERLAQFEVPILAIMDTC